jgi:hypothetical protein
MGDEWYYVVKGSRKGPVQLHEVLDLISKNELGSEDFVWKKGFDTWKRIKEVPDLVQAESHTPEVSMAIPEPVSSMPGVIAKKSIQRLAEIPTDGKRIYIRIGKDRGVPPTEYGPYDLTILKKLYLEKRINGKTEICCTDVLPEWTFLADFKDYKIFFGDEPPPILDEDRRQFTRKPFVAKLFIQNNKKVFEGFCRDISIGGMQVLVVDFPGSAGDKISINVHPDNSDYHFVASGSIVRMLPGNQGFSFRFMNLSEEARTSIEKYIHESHHE